MRSGRIDASYRSIEIIGDPAVASAFATGRHTVGREGETLIVQGGDLGAILEEAGLIDERTGRFVFAALPRGLARARTMRDQVLTVRVNPHLPITVDAAGASVRLRGLEAGLRLRLVACSAHTDQVRGPLDLDLSTSSIRGGLGPTGSSRLACESSAVRVALDHGVGLRIRAQNRIGKVILPGVVSKGGLGDSEALEAVIGDGRDELTIEAVMSSVVLSGRVRRGRDR